MDGCFAGSCIRSGGLELQVIGVGGVGPCLFLHEYAEWWQFGTGALPSWSNIPYEKLCESIRNIMTALLEQIGKKTYAWDGKCFPLSSSRFLDPFAASRTGGSLLKHVQLSWVTCLVTLRTGLWPSTRPGPVKFTAVLRLTGMGSGCNCVKRLGSVHCAGLDLFRGLAGE